MPHPSRGCEPVSGEAMHREPGGPALPRGPHSARTRQPTVPTGPENAEFCPLALMPVADALAAILHDSEPLAEEMVALDVAYRRTLSRDVAARRTQPPQ